MILKIWNWLLFFFDWACCCRQLIGIIMMIFIEMNGNANLQLSPAITDLPDTSSFASKNKSRRQVYAAKHILHDLQVLYNHMKEKSRTSLFTSPPKLRFNLIHNSYTLSLSLSFFSLRDNFNIPGYTALNPAKTHYTATHNCIRSPQKCDVQNVILSFSPCKWLAKALWSANDIYSKIRV